jgi:hypothetical protein
MMLDNDTGKYLHTFIKNENNKCLICDGPARLHFDINDNFENIASEIQVQVTNRIKIDEKLIHAFEDPDLCIICYENNSKSKLQCKHQFCESCIRKYLEINIINGKV